MALMHLIGGLLLMITIIGIPFAVACWKMIPLPLVPLGRQDRADRHRRQEPVRPPGRRWPGPDWAAIVRFYNRLIAIMPTPVVALNRAIAVAETEGPETGHLSHRKISRPAII